jgi:predicted acylesterase/phospholipase RssA
MSRAVGLFCLVLLALASCAQPIRLAAVPRDQTTQATIPGIPNARYYADQSFGKMATEAVAASARERAYRATLGETGKLPTAELLAISGGGDNGAYGAGLLVGWTASGTRPEFKLVTGVSTGALTAPFAFLGPDWDPQLKEVYTKIGPADVLHKRGMTAAIWDDALTDNEPLYGLISKYLDDRMMAAIAREYEHGRLLLIGTTNLDARRPVIWNIGAIAASGQPGALNLIRRLLMASAAVPGVFPPAMIDVEVDGKPYQEMHVDGGAMAQMFLYPPQITTVMRARNVALTRQSRAWLIRNSRLDPDWAAVDRRTYSVAGNAIATMIYSSGVNDVGRIWANTQQDGVDFNLAYIPSDFDETKTEEFDTVFMNKLFDAGYKQGLAGYPWSKSPPWIRLPAPVPAGTPIAVPTAPKVAAGQ